MEKEERNACFSIVMAAALWGCMGVFLRLLTGAGLPSNAGVALRGCLSALLYGLYLAIKEPKALKIDPRHWYYFFGSGVCSLMLSGMCYFHTIQASSMAVAAVLLYTSPAFVILLSALCFHEKITLQKLGALVVTFVGCVLVTGLFPLGQQSVAPGVILWGLCAGFTYALYPIFNKLALRDYGVNTLTFYTCLFMGLSALPFSGLVQHLDRLAAPKALVGAVGISVFCCIAPNLLYNRGLRHTETGRAAILSTAEPMVAALLGVLVYHESVTLYKLAGIAAILAAVLLMNAGGRKR